MCHQMPFWCGIRCKTFLENYGCGCVWAGDLNPGERHSRDTRDDCTVTLCILRATTVLSRDCRADFGRPSTKKVMSHSCDGPGVTAPSRTNIVALTGVWNPPPIRYPPPPPLKSPRLLSHERRRRKFITKIHAHLVFQVCISFLRCLRTSGTPIRKKNECTVRTEMITI